MHNPDQTQWERIAHSDEFKDMMAAKARFVVPSVLFFMTWYFALPYLVGYQPELMRREVIGPINLAYLFALSQFFMTWGVAALYLRKARKFDEMAAKLVAKENK